MGLMDGAVNGMASRLVSAGFNPGEAFSLAQVAYIKEKKRAQGVPSAVLQRSEASQVINQALDLIGPYPSGAEAHRQRIILWEKVFGRGSWPEPFEPTDSYALPASLSDSPSSVEDISNDAAILNGALRYFDTVDLSFAGDRLWLTATLFRGSGDDQKQWNGFVIIFDGMFGFFEESDCLAENIEDGGPVVFQLSELRACTIRTPDEFRWFSGEHVRFLGVSGDFYVTLSFTDNKIMRLFVPFESLTLDLRVEAADSVHRMLQYLQKALELQPDDSMPAATDRPAELLQGAPGSEGEIMMTHELELRDWAKGSYTVQAATELLLNAFQGRFAQPGHPWIWIHELGGAAIDFGQIPHNVDVLSDGERRLMLLVAAIAGVTVDEPVGDLIRHLDEANVDLVLTAIAQAAGRPELHKPARMQVEEEASRALG